MNNELIIGHGSMAPSMYINKKLNAKKRLLKTSFELAIGGNENIFLRLKPVQVGTFLTSLSC